jgi:NTP pyrophosphatase (non-canonical NTP hydrolase)
MKKGFVRHLLARCLPRDFMLKYQTDANAWANECFGKAIATDLKERRQRFLEEAIELAQASGATKEEIETLLNYVFSRPVGQPHQEVGGVMVTLAVLCDQINTDLQDAAQEELARCQANIEKIRRKHHTKPEAIRNIYEAAN